MSHKTRHGLAVLCCIYMRHETPQHTISKDTPLTFLFFISLASEALLLIINESDSNCALRMCLRVICYPFIHDCAIRTL